jgi:hypothetical protein
MTKQKKRRIGLGMEARNGSVPQVGVLSTESAHEVVAEEAEMEVVLGGRETPPLELTGVQNLESEATDAGGVTGGDTIVAQNDDSDRLPEPTAAGEDLLAAMLKESASEIVPQFNVKPIPGREFSNFGGPTEEQLARSIYEDGKTDPREFAGMETVRMVTVEEADKWKKSYGIGIDIGMGEDRSSAAVVRLGENGAADELVAMLDLKPIGPLPNGEYRATVRIAEVYAEGCRQQAEADGISLEDWLTGHLGSYLENWWGAPGAR